MPTIRTITIKSAEAESRPPDRFSRMPVDEAELQAELGIVGDTKASPRRQLNVIFADEIEALEQLGFKTAPGEMGEQIVIEGIRRGDLHVGAQLNLGESAVIELVDDRAPCGRLEAIHGQPRDMAVGRIGFMARVLQGGKIATGQTASVVAVREET